MIEAIPRSDQDITDERQKDSIAGDLRGRKVTILPQEDKVTISISWEFKAILELGP